MNDYKNRFAVKAAAYVIMLICFAATAVSGIAVAYNISNQYYSSGRNAYDDIRLMCLNTAYYDIMDEIETEGLIGYDNKGRATNLLKGDDEEEFLSGENESADFGYVIRQKDDVMKSVNPGIMKSYRKNSNDEDILKHTYHMYELDDCRIDMYIGDIQNGDLPESLRKTASPMMLMYGYRIGAAVLMAVSSVIALALLIFLIAVAGKKGSRFVKYIPLDITAVLSAAAVAVPVSLGTYLEGANLDILVTGITVCAVVAAAAATGWILLFASRVRQGQWWHSTVTFIILSRTAAVLRWIAKQISTIIKSVPVIYKTAILYLAAAAINFIIMEIALTCGYGSATPMLLWITGFIITGTFVLLTAIRMKNIKTGAEHIAAGDLDYQIDERGLYLDLREHAETLNNIREGLSVAVDEKIRSERMKTELITNVSHDIKTPLTSIINYIDFLKKEDLGSDKAAGYVDVLDRQSQRLKKLIEDLTEASKASTGNVKIELAPCDAGVMMTQVMGEYQEKAEKAELRLMLDIPDSSVMIMADGRQLWRILNNLMNNICKYSMPGTRVYQKLETDGDKAVITYRNISKYELNISPEELTERFVRGDSSRHTEGSGLGLSIAQNLTELQNGDFSIDIDGDLFKVTIIFETIRTQ